MIVTGSVPGIDIGVVSVLITGRGKVVVVLAVVIAVVAAVDVVVSTTVTAAPNRRYIYANSSPM